MWMKDLQDKKICCGLSPANFLMFLVGLVGALQLMAYDGDIFFPEKELAHYVAEDCPKPLEPLSAPLDFTATAYCEAGITKSGAPTAPGVAAGDPLVLPLGSLVLVENESFRAVLRVLDTGRLVKGRIVDVFMTYHPRHNDGRHFGVSYGFCR